MEKKIFLSGVAYNVGNLVQINQATGISPEILDKLKDDGLETFSDFEEGNIQSLMLPAITETMQCTGVRPSDIDLVVFSTASLWQAENLALVSMSRFLNSLGLSKANYIISALQTCHNFSTLLWLAKNAILGDGMKNVLVVTADVTPRQNRLMAHKKSVYSDASASCLITSSTGEYEILKVQQGCCHEKYTFFTGAADSNEFAEGTIRVYDDMKKKIEDILSGEQISNNDISVFIASNFSRSISCTVTEFMGMGKAKKYEENVGRIAHAYSADELINIKDMRSGGGLHKGEIVLLLSTAPMNYGVTLLKSM